jgi:N-acetylmuramoyl-L-alanine amidase
MSRAPIRHLTFWLPALALACGPALSDPVRVYVGGQLVEAEAQLTDDVVTGELLPVLAAMEVETSFAPDRHVLSATAPDGTRVQAAIGSNQLQVNGHTTPCSAAFQEQGAEVTGPLAEVAQALGCAVRLDEQERELRIAHRLTHVEATAAEGAALLYLRFSGSAKAELRHLADPPRAYADFAGLVWRGGSETLDLGGAGGLRRARWALFQEWPPITRVVADLEPGARAQLSQVADRLLVLTVRPSESSGTAEPAPRLENAHIVLDPAAGGTDYGGAAGETRGKAVNLDIAIRLAVRLMDAGVLVTLTRDSDLTVSSDDRVRLANQVKADLVLTIQCGEGDSPDECGTEVRSASQDLRALAAALQAALVDETGQVDCGISLSPDGCLPGITAPYASAIVGFLTCPADAQCLASAEHRDKVASGLLRGIAPYLQHNAQAEHAATEEAPNQ